MKAEAMTKYLHLRLAHACKLHEPQYYSWHSTHSGESRSAAARQGVRDLPQRIVGLHDLGRRIECSEGQL
jgi:hypothetical protein